MNVIWHTADEMIPYSESLGNRHMYLMIDDGKEKIVTIGYVYRYSDKTDIMIHDFKDLERQFPIGIAIPHAAKHDASIEKMIGIKLVCIATKKDRHNPFNVTAWAECGLPEIPDYSKLV
jgi:hypothetical protein